MRHLLFFASFFVVFLSDAQTVSVGPRLGYHWGGISETGEIGRVRVNSVIAGGIINVSFNPLFSLQLEGAYTTKGGGFGYRLNKVNYEESYRFRTLEFPLLAKFTIGQSKAKLILMGGPYVAYVLKATYYYEDDISKFEEELLFTSYNVYDYKVNRLDFGIQLGGGMSMDIGKGKLLTELRFGAGFRDWFKFESAQSAQNSLFGDISHRTWAMTIGYIMPVFGDI